MKLSTKEIATVLAALRYWQKKTSDEGRFADEHFDPMNSNDPLDNEEIDALCERINLGEEPEPETVPAMPTATIAIRGGIAELVEGSEANVTVRDYDIDGSDDDTETDTDGDIYHEYYA